MEAIPMFLAKLGEKVRAEIAGQRREVESGGEMWTRETEDWWREDIIERIVSRIVLDPEARGET